MEAERPWIALAALALAVAACGDAPAPTSAGDAGARPPALAGRALDEDGKPLPGARITVDPVPPFPEMRDARVAAETTAAADGAFAFATLDAGDWTVRCAADGAVRVFAGTIRLPDVPRFDVVLPHGGIYDGTLVDDTTGAPVAGGRVRALSEDGCLADVTTDAEGRFTFDLHRIGEGIERWRIEVPGRRSVPEGVDDTCEITSYGAGEHVPIALRARPGATVRGVVTSPSGPVAGADVRLWYFIRYGDGGTENGTRDAKTDAKGAYEFAALDGAAFVVRIDAPGLVEPNALDEGALDPRGWPGTAPGACRVALDEGATELKHDVSLVATVQNTCTVAGRVHDGAGVAIAGVKVRAGLGLEFVEGTTAADGSFSLAAVWCHNGWTSVSISPPQFEPFADTIEVTDDGTAPAVDAELRPVAHVAGRVTDLRGDAVAGAKVQIVLLPNPDEQPSVGGGPPFEPAPRAETVTDAEGRYSLRFRSDGVEAFVVVTAPGFGPGRIGLERDGTEPEIETDVTLSRFATLAGRVVRDGSDVPVAGVCVSDVGDESQDWYDAVRDGRALAVTGADGSFEIRRMTAGVRRLNVWGNGWLPRMVTVEIPLVSAIRVDLSPALAVRGRLLFEDGAATKDVRVLAYAAPPDAEGNWSDQVGATVRTHADGTFAIRELAPGRYWLQVYWGEPEVIKTALGPFEADAELVREMKAPRGASIDGRIFDENGRPWAGAPISMEAVPAGGERRPGASGTAYGGDEAGKFHIGGLDAGPYDVEFFARGYLPLKFSGVRTNAAPLVVKLDPGLTIEGRIVGSDGTPMAHTTIVATPEDPDVEAEEDHWSAYTDDEGAFRISGLTPGFWHLDFAGDDRTAAKGTQRLPDDSEFAAGTKDVRLRCVAVVPTPK